MMAILSGLSQFHGAIGRICQTHLCGTAKPCPQAAAAHEALEAASVTGNVVLDIA
jgi:hypothetical protein